MWRREEMMKGSKKRAEGEEKIEVRSRGALETRTALLSRKHRIVRCSTYM